MDPLFAPSPISPESALLSRSAEAGLHVALIEAGVRSGDHVLTPALASAALAGALVRAGADPILVDVDPSNWLIDLHLMEEFLMGHTIVNERDELILRKTGKAIRAVIPVHLNGNPADMNQLRFIAHRFYLKIIEDVSEATGSFFLGRPAGVYGDLAVFSLDAHPSGYDEKGALLISRDEQAMAALPRHPLLSRYPYEFHLVRINLQQLPALRAASTQSKSFLEFIQKAFHQLPGLQWQHAHPEAEPAFQTMSFSCSRARELRRYLAQEGVLTTTFTPPLHQLPAFRNGTYIRRDDHAAQLFEQVVRIPGIATQEEKDWQELAKTIWAFFNP